MHRLLSGVQRWYIHRGNVHFMVGMVYLHNEFLARIVPSPAETNKKNQEKKDLIVNSRHELFLHRLKQKKQTGKRKIS